MRPEVLAVIPARGGSKGLPKKNIRILCGKPLIAWTIEAALGADFVSRTVVTTEDKKIAEIAEEYGAEVIKRPKELATNTTLIQPVLEHTLEFLEQKEDYRPEAIILLNPTSPLRNSQHIDQALHKFLHGVADTLLSVFPSVVCLWEKRAYGTYRANYDFKNKARRQDMTPQLQENGAIYIARRKFLLENHRFIGGRLVFSQMTEECSVDIDTALDFVIAEAIINASGIVKPKVKGT